ncbi:MAG: hypothetical protein ACOX57_04710 [Limnochordia bacterium]|jgi:DNA-directed RNA polymerase subunit RPC12/RpoP
MTVSMMEFKCPNCGAPIEFDPGIQEMRCPYCESTLNVEALQALDESQEEKPEPMAWGYEGSTWQEGEQAGLAVYSCRSCAGEIVADETLGATTCPFCDNPVVFAAKFSGTFRPDVVIPFKVSKAEAVAALKKHYLGKKLLPKVFQDENHLEEVKGVYVPFWLFEAETAADLEYKATKVRVWSDSQYNYRETSHFRIFRSGQIAFTHVPVDGSRAIDDRLTQSIEPYQMEEATSFKAPYLAGYFANKYDVEAAEAETAANRRMENSTARAFEETIKGYDLVTPLKTHIQLKRGKLAYALLPVWLLSTKWQDQSFTFAMNGQTGKFVGDLPVDPAAYWSLFGKVFGAAFVLLSAVLLTIIGLM